MSYGFRDVHAISKCHDATVRTIFDVDVNDTVTFTDWDVLSGPFSEEPGGGKGGNNIDDVIDDVIVTADDVQGAAGRRPSDATAARETFKGALYFGLKIV